MNAFLEDRQIVSSTLSAAAANDQSALASSINSLTNRYAFLALDGETKTAILCQIKNYPDVTVVDNLTRMIGKD